MRNISKQDEGLLLSLFNRDGYVLDFSDSKFKTFTTASVGISIKDTYGLSKGKSLVAFLNDADVDDDHKERLVWDLLHYYEQNMQWEYKEDYQDEWGTFDNSRYNATYASLFNKCKIIEDRITGVTGVISDAAKQLKTKFSSEYLSQQIDLMVSLQDANPTQAIGLAKELIESCCKTILDDLGVTWSQNDDVPQLTNATMKELNLLPDGVQSTDRGADAIKAMLGNLRGITTKLAELRNPFGSGHGKAASFQGLEPRHAKLAVGCSVTFVNFIWSTYENQKATGTKDI